MGRLIDTGIEVDGHTSRILYREADDSPVCVLERSCGWSVPIASYQNSWSIIEVQVRFHRHMAEDYRQDYNQNRPHSSLGYMTPNEFKQKWHHNNQELTTVLAH